MIRSITLAFACSLALAAGARTDQITDLFVIEGRVLELDVVNNTDKPASKVQVIIYQDNEIYVAFFTQANGYYEFHLPLGHEYEIQFGGDAYVNKRAYIDAREVKPRAGQTEIALDMGLFKPIENVPFEILKEPIVRFAWDTEYGHFLPDLDHAGDMARELEKTLRKVRKTGTTGN
ncbi:MAG: hypothetical protein ACK5XV_04495 [Flavobacteriales bacterium]|jgi:hypothetical protein